MKYNIRKAKLEDARGIAKVHITSWRETYRGIVDDEYLKSLSIETKTKKWENILKTPKADKWTFVAKDENGKIVGFISGGSAQEHFPKFAGELYAICILKKDQGKKLGYRLTKKLCSMLQKLEINTMYVCVLADNKSKNFYTTYGGELFKTKRINIGKHMLQEEYYGWKNFENFLT